MSPARVLPKNDKGLNHETIGSDILAALESAAGLSRQLNATPSPSQGSGAISGPDLLLFGR